MRKMQFMYLVISSSDNKSDWNLLLGNPSYFQGRDEKEERKVGMRNKKGCDNKFHSLNRKRD